MLYVSKILTTQKLHVVETLSSNELTTASPPFDYFQIGLPILDPPLIRGSMILSLDISFLRDNEAFFDYGSPVDVGGIRFGFLRPPEPDLFIQKQRCNHTRFWELITELAELPQPAVQRLAEHRNTPAAAAVLTRHLDSAVVDFMLRSHERTAWMFEFSLRRHYHLSIDHVLQMTIPNTYATTSKFATLRQLMGSRLRLYNPKFGVECHA